MTARPLPTGTVTFLRSDVVGSMALARSIGPGWDDLNTAHLAVIRAAVMTHDGVVVRTEGDAVFAAFAEAGAAVAAAVDAQRGLASHVAPDGTPIRVRMGLHSGEAHLAGDDYGGFDVNRAARVAAVAHGGQIVVSGTTTALVADSLPAGVTLRDLGRHILRDVPRPEELAQLVIEGLPSDFPPPLTGDRTAGNLPERLTSFVGRDRELADLVAVVADARLVTLTGPGGIGKSSLAIEVARTATPGAHDGVWFVALADIDDATLVPSTIAWTLGLHDGAERTAAAALPGFLAERATLLVLDNMEHVLDAASTVGDVLRASPRSRILVTSRAPLRINGEHEVPVSPLALDGPDGARRLFEERVSAVRPGWSADGEAPVVDEICALLDGLPLGIELAAARAGKLPLVAIRDRLAARLPLPGVGKRDAPDRQRTLDGAVAWSYDLLGEADQSVLRRLAVFEGGFDLEQATAVAAEPGDDLLDLLLRLAEQHLIEPDERTAGRIRFRMLRTISSFGLGRLREEDDEAAARRRHATAFADLVEASARHIGTSSQPAWIDRLAPDDANIRSATRWAIDTGDVVLAQRLAAAAWRYWNASGQLADGRALVDAVIDMRDGQDPTSLRSWALAAAGSIAYWQGQPRIAMDRYRDQLSVATAVGDRAAIADAHFNLGHVAYIEGATEPEMLEFAERTTAMYRELGDERGLARSAWAFGIIAMEAGRLEESLALLEGQLELFAANDDPVYHAMTLSSVGWAMFT
ncbi:MAG TPA: NB-ARC domain-containing protein, partial [Candidatus Limnocylindrales bacterium]